MISFWRGFSQMLWWHLFLKMRGPILMRRSYLFLLIILLIEAWFLLVGLRELLNIFSDWFISRDQDSLLIIIIECRCIFYRGIIFDHFQNPWLFLLTTWFLIILFRRRYIRLIVWKTVIGLFRHIYLLLFRCQPSFLFRIGLLGLFLTLFMALCICRFQFFSLSFSCLMNQTLLDIVRSFHTFFLLLLLTCFVFLNFFSRFVFRFFLCTNSLPFRFSFMSFCWSLLLTW